MKPSDRECISLPQETTPQPPGPAIASDLGARLRRTRTAAKFTLDWAAAQVGLTKGYLSKIERGHATPSIAVLNRLADVYGVTLAEVFMPEGERKPITVVRRNEHRTINRSGTEFGYRYDVGDFSKLNPKSEVFFLTLPTMEHPEKIPPFRHSGEEVLLVLEGQIVFNYGGVDILLSEGDCIQFEAEIEHFGHAVGGRDARAFVVTIPDRTAMPDLR